MSFSGNIKEELERIVAPSRHCQLAEMAAIYDFCGKTSEETEGEIVISSENELPVRKFFTLFKKTFNMYNDRYGKAPFYSKIGAYYRFAVDDADRIGKVRSAIRMTTDTMRSCCRRAYVRGAFLAAGSVSDPEKSYHLEIVCQDERQAHFLAELLASFEIEAKTVIRKKYHVLYVKDGSNIVETLNVMGAHVALMDFENMRILKEMRNSVNRKVNCETANIGKTVTAAQRQIDDIRRLMNRDEYEHLSPALKAMAELRVSYPEATLKELGELSEPPLGKSGVNHRLRKLSQMAQESLEWDKG
ncbi:MAG: DNA-binding protein WhiA [Lachnospiraceae bacterium]|nr:DNA-binding protein WhiA [Lachnospiraceae bacterium]